MNKILMLILVLGANNIYADSNLSGYTENDYWAEVEKMHSGGFSGVPESELSGYNEDNSIYNSEPTKLLDDDLVDLTEDMNHFQKILFGLLKEDKISVEEAERLLEEND